MFGWRTHGGRLTGAPGRQRPNGALAPDDSDDSSNPGNWNEEVVRFTTKRIDSYGVLLNDVGGCRNLLDLVQVQQRWWLSTVQDYAGFATGLYDRAPQISTTAASAESEQGRADEGRSA